MNGDRKEEQQPVFRIATSTLRYVRRPAEPGEFGIIFDGKKRVLQQAWLAADGSFEWRDIPTVDEP